MPLKTVIKWFHYALTLILLIIVIGFVMLNAGGDNRADDKLVSSQKINDSTGFMSRNIQVVVRRWLTLIGIIYPGSWKAI